MDFHIITPSARVHLFSAEDGLIVNAPIEPMGPHTVEPMREARIPLTKEALYEIEERNSDLNVRVLL